LYKAVCFSLIYLSIVFLPSLFNAEAYYGNFHRQPVLSHSLDKHLETWDAQHYLFLSDSGYQTGSMSAAFYPLWPFIIRIFSVFTGGNTLLAGLVLSNGFSVAALALLHTYLRRRRDERVANRTVLLILAFPGAIFFLFPYTESLFLLLSLLIWILLDRNHVQADNRPGWRTGFYIGTAAFLAALTRATGVLWCVPLAVHFIRNRRIIMLPLAGLPLLGFATYLGIMYMTTGNAFEGLASQKQFIADASIVKVFDVAAFFQALISPQQQTYGFMNAVWDRVWFIWFCVTLWPLYKRDREMFAYALVMGLVPAMTASFMSYTRYVLMVFPTFIMTAELLAPPRRNAFFAVTLALFFTLQILFLIRHINFYWVA